MKLEKDAAIQKKLLQLIKINSGQSNIQWSIVLFCLTSSFISLFELVKKLRCVQRLRGLEPKLYRLTYTVAVSIQDKVYEYSSLTAEICVVCSNTYDRMHVFCAYHTFH